MRFGLAGMPILREELVMSAGSRMLIDGSLLVRHGQGDRRREAGTDQFGLEQLAAWLTVGVFLPPGRLFGVIDGPTRGRRWAATAARAELRQLATGQMSVRAPSTASRGCSNWPARAWRSTSSSASSATPTSVPPLPTCRESTPARSLTLSARGDSRRSQPLPDSRSNEARRPPMTLVRRRSKPSGMTWLYLVG